MLFIHINLCSRQGEEVPEVPEEEDWIARPREEEEGGDAGRPAGHEEEGRRLILIVKNLLILKLS